MSRECSECECDSRGGHDESCSRHQYCECGHAQHDHDFENETCARCACREYNAARAATGGEG